MKRLYDWILFQVTDSVRWRRLNGWLVVFWTGMFVVSIAMSWLNVVAYIAILSIYANWATHLGVWAASRSEAMQVEDYRGAGEPMGKTTSHDDGNW